MRTARSRRFWYMLQKCLRAGRSARLLIMTEPRVSCDVRVFVPYVCTAVSGPLEHGGVDARVCVDS